MQITLLGPVTVRGETGEPVPVGGPKPRAVLALLALHAGKVVSVDGLVDAIWEDDPPASARGTIQVYVHAIRKALGDPALVVSQAPGYRLTTPAVSVDLVDLAELREVARRALAAGELTAAQAALDRARGLAVGAPLADLTDYAFARNAAVEISRGMLDDTETWADIGLQLGRHRELLGQLEHLVAAHPTREKLWWCYLVALYRSDRQGDAIAVFRRVREVLADELGIDPGRALRDLEVAILRQDPSLDPPARTSADAQDSPQPRPVFPPPPVPVHPMVGRHDLTSLILDQVTDSALRLLTVIGPGGVGKTRLSVEVAKVAVADGRAVLFVPLADAVTVEACWHRIGEVVGLAPDASTPAAVADMLNERQALVILDNVEQVVSAAQLVTTLLDTVADATFLVTSRTALRVRAEHVHPLGPLPEAAAQELFLARARGARPGYATTEADRAGVRGLCDRLEGLPLALEIAAARARLFSPGDMLRHLEEGLVAGLGSAGPVDLPERQRSLAATVAWSLDLLSAPVAEFCARLTVFPGSFTAAAAIDVCARSDPSALDQLGVLIDSSLVYPLDVPGDARFAMFTIVREFAAGRVAEPDRNELVQRHLARTVDQVEDLVPSLNGHDHHWVQETLDNEEANWVAAMVAARTHAASADRLAAALTPYWIAAGRVRQGEELIDLLPGSATVTACAGMLAYHLGDWPRAIDRLSSCVGELGDPLRARAQCHLAAALTVTGEVASGKELAQQVLADADDYEVRVLSLSATAIAAAIDGDFAEERSRYEQRLALTRGHGDRARTVDTLATLAEIDLDLGDWESARRRLDEAVTLSSAGMIPERRDCLILLGRIAIEQRRLDDAARALAEALALSQRLGESFGLSQTIRTIAGLALTFGQPERAARLVGASDRLRRAVMLGEGVEVDLARFADAVRDRLPAGRYAEEVAAGSSLSRPDLMSLAHQVVSGSSTET